MQFWNAELPGYHAGFDPLYQSIPFCLGMDGPRAHGLYVDNTFRQWWDLGEPGTTGASIAVADGALTVYLFTAPEPKSVLNRWTDLVGRIPLPPLWAMGYQQSRWSYYPENVVRGIAGEFRSRAIPCDVIWFDIDYMQGFKVFTWDPDRFPNPARLIEDLKADGFQSVLMLDPGVKVEEGYPVYEELKAAGFYVKNPDGSPFVGPVWPGDCLFPDFTNPACRAWWGDLYRPLLEQGAAGFWNDMNEPAVFEAEGHTMPMDVLHDGDGRPDSHLRYHNVYGMQMVRATYEGVRRNRPRERAFVLTRSGFAGTHRYAATWTGDNRADWEGLWLSLPMVMNFGLSGQALSGPDIGGFMGDPTPELFTRWIQAGALFPFCRCHHAASKHEGEFDRLDASAQEPWSHGGEYEAVNRASIELRYRLLPYLYTLAEEAARTGVPILRPLFLEYPDDPRCKGLDDQFLLGRDLLCAPVLQEGATSRTVYLPPGDWYDFWSGERLEGGRDLTVEAPLSHLPLYVRAGAVLPMQPVVQHTGEMRDEPLILRAYLDNGRAEGEVYEDDGITLDFERGAFRRTRAVVTREGGEANVEMASEGSYISPRPEPVVEVIGR